MSDKMRVKVQVPATSANLGGGFDCLGIALGLYHTITAEKSDRLEIVCDADVPRDETNLIYRAMNAVFIKRGSSGMPVKITSHSDIPQAGGLGSSAACIVAGVVAANALTGGAIDLPQIIDLCASLDGHPDNVLPAIVGGVTAAYSDGDTIGYIRQDVSDKLVTAVATPDFGLKTAVARRALPDMYSRADCVYSLSRAVVTFGAIALGQFDALEAVGDKLHQPYRIPLVKGFSEVDTAFRAAGAISCCLSGSGPSVLAFFKTEPKNVRLPDGWKLRVLHVENRGYILS